MIFAQRLRQAKNKPRLKFWRDKFQFFFRSNFLQTLRLKFAKLISKRYYEQYTSYTTCTEVLVRKIVVGALNTDKVLG